MATPVRQRSITRRVVWTVLLAQLLAAAVLSFAAFSHERRARLAELDAAVQGGSDSLLGAVQDAEDTADNVSVDPEELRVPPGDRWAVMNADGSPVGRSAGGGALRYEPQRPDGIYDEWADGVRFRLLQRHALRIIDRAETDGAGLRRPVILLYASPRTHLLSEALKSASFYVLMTVVVSSITAVLVAVVLRRSLRPVLELSTAAARLTLPQLIFAPPASASRIAELQPLAATLSRVADELREAFAREQQFVGDASHELKTAVAVLRSTLQVLMLKTRAAEEYQAGLSRALEDTDRLESLVRQMLDLARMDGAADADTRAADLSLCARRVLAEMAPLSRQQEVQLVGSLAPGAMAPISAERAHILITNLVLNAIQHSPPTTEILLSVSSIGSGGATLRVQDHGEGIDATALPHIFERFYRADASRARDTGGTGLGLAICRSIVERAGGTVDVQSAPGQGTTVTVIFTVV